MTRSIAPYATALVAAVTLAAGWWVPGTVLCAVLGWVGAGFFALHLVHHNAHYRSIYLGGIVAIAMGFFWLYRTIAYFGHFPFVAAAPIFALFVAVSALQFLFFAFIYRNLPRALDILALRGAIAWCAAEVLSIRIFPWHLGHTQLAFQTLAQAASIGGATLLSFLMMWAVESLARWKRDRATTLGAIPAMLALCLTVAYGSTALSTIYFDTKPGVSVALVQGNVPLEAKHDPNLFERNIAHYAALSSKITDASVVIWPESTVALWIHDQVGNARNDPRLAALQSARSLIFGTLSFQDPQHYFNSVMMIAPDGTIPEPYHKQILMPFGEFTPFAKTFPWLKQINATAAEFSWGAAPVVFSVPSKGADGKDTKVAMAPLICYEDVAPRLAREATLQGAEVLVNLTNDAWFGDTVAPDQHHLIASFRAIENRRFLLRATNTGRTAVVDPAGATVAKLSNYSEGVLTKSVTPGNALTIYTQYIGEAPWRVLGIAVVLIALLRAVHGMRRRKAP